jgi:hypothetical protein
MARSVTFLNKQTNNLEALMRHQSRVMETIFNWSGPTSGNTGEPQRVARARRMVGGKSKLKPSLAWPVYRANSSLTESLDHSKARHLDC